MAKRVRHFVGQVFSCVLPQSQSSRVPPCCSFEFARPAGDMTTGQCAVRPHTEVVSESVSSYPFIDCRPEVKSWADWRRDCNRRLTRYQLDRHGAAWRERGGLVCDTTNRSCEMNLYYSSSTQLNTDKGITRLLNATFEPVELKYRFYSAHAPFCAVAVVF